MIFKTFDSTTDKTSSKWGILGKSFNAISAAIAGNVNDIKKNFQATDDLRTSIKNSDSIWKRLYPNKKSIKSQLIDIEASYPKMNESDAQKTLDFIKSIETGTNSEIKSFQELYDTKNKQNQWIAKYAQETKGQIRSTEDVINANKAARASAIAHNEALKQQTLGAKASKVALQALSAVGNMLAMWAISEVISGITAIAQSAEKTAEKAKELGSEFSSTKSDIEGYKTKISELHETINNNTSSIYEVTEARRSLLQIQDEMIEKYGSEKGTISDITTAINGQADALDNLVQKEWLKTKN